MSFFSRSSKKNKYRNPHQGSGYYKKKSGLLGNLLKQFASVSSRKEEYYNNGYPGSNGQKKQPIFNMISCSQCGSEVPEGSKFCLECGQKIISAMFCPSCGEKLPANSKFCLKCGQKIG